MASLKGCQMICEMIGTRVTPIKDCHFGARCAEGIIRPCGLFRSELFHLPARAHENMSAIPDNGRFCRDFRRIFQ